MNQSKGKSMDRRDALKGIGMAGLTFAGGLAGAAAPTAVASPKVKVLGAITTTSPKHEALRKALAACLDSCELCIAHCQELLARGDTMLADCLKKCLELVPLCRALQSLVNYKSTFIEKTAAVCHEACLACAEACKPHVDHHVICKACFEACERCAEVCKSVTR